MPVSLSGRVAPATAAAIAITTIPALAVAITTLAMR